MTLEPTCSDFLSTPVDPTASCSHHDRLADLPEPQLFQLGPACGVPALGLLSHSRLSNFTQSDRDKTTRFDYLIHAQSVLAIDIIHYILSMDACRRIWEDV